MFVVRGREGKGKGKRCIDEGKGERGRVIVNEWW